MKLLLLFFLSNADWQNLRPEEKAGSLHRRRNLSPEEREYLMLFQASELQTGWSCKKIVIMWNAGIVIAILCILQFFGISSQQIIALAHSLFP